MAYRIPKAIIAKTFKHIAPAPITKNNYDFYPVTAPPPIEFKTADDSESTADSLIKTSRNLVFTLRIVARLLHDDPERYKLIMQRVAKLSTLLDHAYLLEVFVAAEGRVTFHDEEMLARIKDFAQRMLAMYRDALIADYC
jgi:hypothetical protein